MATGFFAPFGIAGTTILAREISKSDILEACNANCDCSLPNLQERGLNDSSIWHELIRYLRFLQWRAARGNKATDNVVIKEARIDFLAVICTDCNIIPFVDTILEPFLRL